MVGEGDARAIPLKILSGRVHYLHDVRNYEGKINGFIVTGELAY